MTCGKRTTYFNGLDSLRFIAAMLVVFSHIYLGLGYSELPRLPAWPVLLNGKPAVQLFFCLSGFLITYLLLGENNRDGIAIKRFYIRRALRIWPLYFSVVGFGLFFYLWLLPMVRSDHPGTDYSLGTALTLYSLFLPNAMLAFYQVGGILAVTWSIGVEEQFYTLWAPLLKYFKQHILRLLCVSWLLTTALQILNSYNYFGLSEATKGFIYSLQFNFMITGAMGAYLYFHRGETLMQHWLFRSKLAQISVYCALLSYYLIFANGNLAGLQFLSLPIAITWLILNTGANPKCLLPLSNHFINHLGTISYGIYMYHFIVIYLCSFIAEKLYTPAIPDALFIGIFHMAVIVLSIAVAQLSYLGLERPFLRLKHNFQA